MQLAQLTRLSIALLTGTSLLIQPAVAGPNVTFVGDNPKDKQIAQRAAATILQRKDCQRDNLANIDLETGAFLSKSLGLPFPQMQKHFHESIPTITAKTRLFVMECKVASGGFDNFWLREQDIGHVNAVFRQGGD